MKREHGGSVFSFIVIQAKLSIHLEAWKFYYLINRQILLCAAKTYTMHVEGSNRMETWLMARIAREDE